MALNTAMEIRKNNSFDFLIVGQGIAGSVLAIQLIENGYSVCVIDKPELSLSSKVAAGIWNPIVFKRLTESWLASALVAELISFYTACETLFNTKLLHHRNIIKPFTEEQEKKLWLKKSQENHTFLDTNLYTNFKLSPQQNFDNYSKVKNAGNIDLATFLEYTQRYLKENQSYLKELFIHADLIINPDSIHYKSISAKHIIFCEGYLISQNPYFNWIPMKPAKGETLTIRCEGLNLENDIFNKGIFLMPLGNHTYKVGATYAWDDLNDKPTDPKKQELESKLKELLKVPFTVISHDAGVRPSVIDRRPVIGVHPEHKNCYLFNGFGTKAVMLAPYLAKEFIQHFTQKTLIDPEVNVARFYQK